jgi:hypothetical protein
MILKEDKGIIYEMLEEEDIEETAKLVSETFTGGDPLAIALKITPDEYYYAAEIYCKKAIKEGLSMIARDMKNGKIVSFMINEDFDSPKPEGIDKMAPKALIGMELIDMLEKEIKVEKKEGERRFHLFLGGTDKGYENKHILSNLMDESMKLAKNKNFTSIIAEPTCFPTQHICNKLGFIQKNFINYKKFQFHGLNVLENINGPLGIPLMEKRI